MYKLTWTTGTPEERVMTGYEYIFLMLAML